MKRILFPLLVTAVLAVSCSTPTEIAYFQDTADKSVSVPVTENHIRLRPEDKVLIMVNTTNDQLNALYNLPYSPSRIGQLSSSVNSTYNQAIAGYTVDSRGDIDFPVLGTLHVGGMTRDELAAHVKQQLISNNLAKDVVVTVEFMNLTVSVLGEVNRPGRYAIEKDKVTIIDAIGMAGDLTIFGVRNNVRVLRNENGEQKSYTVNLTSARGAMSSPAFYIQQDDIIYVDPNPVRARQSTVNGNNLRSTSTWISLASLGATVTTLVLNAVSRR